ncbi:MAG: hypothetical protein MJ252_04140 [archaeon]|nr:hypothetical protein [archaeon]
MSKAKKSKKNKEKFLDDKSEPNIPARMNIAGSSSDSLSKKSKGQRSFQSQQVLDNFDDDDLEKRLSGDKNKLGEEEEEVQPEESKTNKNEDIKSSDNNTNKLSKNSKSSKGTKSKKSSKSKSKKTEEEKGGSTQFPKIDEEEGEDGGNLQINKEIGNAEENKEIELKTNKALEDDAISQKTSELMELNDYLSKGSSISKPYKSKEHYKSKYDAVSISSQSSVVSNKGKNSLTVDPNRVEFLKDPGSIGKLELCCQICHQFPISPSACIECLNNFEYAVYCPKCKKKCKKCEKCNSVLKTQEPTGDLKIYFDNAIVNCIYSDLDSEHSPLKLEEFEEHEKECGSKIKICPNCKKQVLYSEYKIHQKNCLELNKFNEGVEIKGELKKCEICDYEDYIEDFTKTEKKFEHFRHLLLGEIESTIKNVVEEKLNVLIEKQKKESELAEIKEKERKKKEQENIAMINNLKESVNTIQEKLIVIENKIDEGNEDKKRIIDKYQADQLRMRIKNIKLISTPTNNIDKGYESDNKFCVIETFSGDNIIVYPTINYDIAEYNMSTEKNKIVVAKAHKSNIICMTYIKHFGESKTYLATASFDKSIKIFSIEDNWKNIKTYSNAHSDYSIFSIDGIFNKEIGPIVISGNNKQKEIKVWEINSEQKGAKSFMNGVGSICFIKHNPYDPDSNIIYVGSEKGIFTNDYMDLKFGEEKKSKDYNDPKGSNAKHLCMTFLENNEDIFCEGDSLGKVRIWEIKTAKLIQVIERGNLKSQINSLSEWSKDYIIAGTRDGKIVLYDMNEKKFVDNIGQHDGYVYCVTVFDHWKYQRSILSCGFDGVIKLWAPIGESI